MPRSIKLFAVLYFLSLLLSAGSLIFFFDSMFGPDLELMEESASILRTSIFAALVGYYAVMVALGILVVQKRSRIAKWILAALGVLSIIDLVSSAAADYADGAFFVVTISSFLYIAGVTCLFLRDARDWFARREAPNFEVFE